MALEAPSAPRSDSRPSPPRNYFPAKPSKAKNECVPADCPTPNRSLWQDGHRGGLGGETIFGSNGEETYREKPLEDFAQTIHTFLEVYYTIKTRPRKGIMGFSELLQWQWQGYENFHHSRGNLWIHIFAVPVFCLSSLGCLSALLHGAWLSVIGEAILMALAFGVQGIGHKTEAVPSIPFSSAGNAFARIFAEQWITFPRFVLTGGWWRALSNS